MKLLTHNLLCCNKAGCTINDYPLKIMATNVINKKHEYDAENIKHFLKKVDWNGLKEACLDLHMPLKVNYDEMTEEQKGSSEFLDYMNTLLFETIIQDGILKCKKCGREYPIVNGITNLILNDNEL